MYKYILCFQMGRKKLGQLSEYVSLFHSNSEDKDQIKNLTLVYITTAADLAKQFKMFVLLKSTFSFLSFFIPLFSFFLLHRRVQLTCRNLDS